jgi:hypothetical protein
MSIRLILALLSLCVLVPTANAACYGPKEKALAQQLLASHPALATKLARESNGVWFVRYKACNPRALKPEDGDFFTPFFNEPGWKPLVEASLKRHLVPGLVMVAMADLQERGSP